MNLFVRGDPRPSGTALELDLQAYNRRVLQHQDEAFTLAADLLGDDALTALVVQQVFLEAYARDRQQPEPAFRWQILRRVIQACRQHSDRLPGPPALEQALSGLSCDQKVLLLLIDRLELSYPDAAAVLRKPLSYIRSTLGSARITMSKTQDRGITR